MNKFMDYVFGAFGVIMLLALTILMGAAIKLILIGDPATDCENAAQEYISVKNVYVYSLEYQAKVENDFISACK